MRSFRAPAEAATFASYARCFVVFSALVFIVGLLVFADRLVLHSQLRGEVRQRVEWLRWHVQCLHLRGWPSLQRELSSDLLLKQQASLVVALPLFTERHLLHA